MNAAQPRGILPDAMDKSRIILIKGCAYLRLTYEIRLATALAREQNRKFWLAIREDCQLAPALQKFAAEHQIVIHRAKG